MITLVHGLLKIRPDIAPTVFRDVYVPRICWCQFLHFAHTSSGSIIYVRHKMIRWRYRGIRIPRIFDKKVKKSCNIYSNRIIFKVIPYHLTHLIGDFSNFPARTSSDNASKRNLSFFSGTLVPWVKNGFTHSKVSFR